MKSVRIGKTIYSLDNIRYVKTITDGWGRIYFSFYYMDGKTVYSNYIAADSVNGFLQDIQEAMK